MSRFSLAHRQVIKYETFHSKINHFKSILINPHSKLNYFYTNLLIKISFFNSPWSWYQILNKWITNKKNAPSKQIKFKLFRKLPTLKSGLARCCYQQTNTLFVNNIFFYYHLFSLMIKFNYTLTNDLSLNSKVKNFY